MRSHTLWVVVAIIAIILLLVGGFGSALHFLLYVGFIVLAIAVILFLVRILSGNRR